MRAVTWTRSVSLAVVIAVFVASAAAQAVPSGASPGGASQAPRDEEAPDEVRTNSDEAMAKLAPELQEQVESGSTERIPVFATTAGDASEAAAHLDDAHVAESAGAGLVVGTIAVPALPKLAGAAGIVAVGPISFEQDGQPLGIPDPEVGRKPDAAAQQAALREMRRKEVPHSKAPALAPSNFDELRELGVLDAKTHNFVEAWEAGYTGEGSTVGVLDGGTDFGHPDLIGTWQVWSGLTGARAGWNGWPKAFDPFGTLQWLAAPDQVEQGLSW